MSGAIVFKATAPREEGERINKADLVGCAIAMRVSGYRTDWPTSYGPSPRVDGTLWVLDGELEGCHEDVAFFGNLAKQIGVDAEVGDYRLGVITSGTSASGRPWYGLDDRSGDAEVVKAATAAINGKQQAVSDEAPF